MEQVILWYTVISLSTKVKEFTKEKTANAYLWHTSVNMNFKVK